MVFAVHNTCTSETINRRVRTNTISAWTAGATYLSRVDVDTRGVHVGVVREEDVDRRPRSGSDGRAGVARGDDVSDLAVLSYDAEAQRLQILHVILLLTAGSVIRDTKAGSTTYLSYVQVVAAYVDGAVVHYGELVATSTQSVSPARKCNKTGERDRIDLPRNVLLRSDAVAGVAGDDGVGPGAVRHRVHGCDDSD